MSALAQLFVHGFSVSMSRNHQSIIAHLILHSSCEVDLAWNYVSSRQHFVNEQNWLKSVKPLSLFLNSKWHFKIESAAQSSGIRHGFWSQSCSWWSKLKGFVQVEKFRTCLLLVLSLASLEITKFPVCAHYTRKHVNCYQLGLRQIGTRLETFESYEMTKQAEPIWTSSLRQHAPRQGVQVRTSAARPFAAWASLEASRKLYRITRYYEWVVWPVREF